MASWTLVSCLRCLINEFDAAFPGRDKSSDGAVGDSAHAQRPSDHNPDETGATPTKDVDHLNEVHAVDVDADLRKPGWSMAKAVEVIVTRHRTGADSRLQNIIWNRRIWSRSWSWTAREYTGSNPHDKHAHFSSRYDDASESNVNPWGLLAAVKPPLIKPRTEEFVVATQAEVEAALRKVLNEPGAWQTPAGKRFDDAGWSDLSLRGLAEYTLEAARGAGGAAHFQAEVRAALAAIAADPGNPVVLSDEQLDVLAGRLPAEIAKAVNDDMSRRMTA